MTEKRTLSETEFEVKYQLQERPDGESVFWEDYESTRAQDPRHVWSLVDGDNGEIIAIAGYHVVNVIGYCVTENPWVDGDETGIYSDPAEGL